GIRRVGHCGTLDPLASGLLLILTGAATRLARLITAHSKCYEGSARLGWSTSTYDKEGVRSSPVHDFRGIHQARLEEAAGAFTGRLMQSSPPFSARKVEGVRLYRLARRGEMIRGNPVPVTVTRFEVKLGMAGSFSFKVEVSSGTYVRALVHDLGRELGCMAHLESLRRTAIGPFSLGQALPLAKILGNPQVLQDHQAVQGLHGIPLPLPTLLVDPEGQSALTQGQPFRSLGPIPREGDLFQVRSLQGHLLALASPGPDRLFRPRTVFARPA
ncbi:MAG: tRNA pseudouridine(55) synthase TruB, partial [Acidobacteriota bacterium]